LLPLSFITPANALLVVDAKSAVLGYDIDQDRVTLDSTTGYQAGATIQSQASVGGLSQTRAKADFGTLGVSTAAQLDDPLVTQQAVIAQANSQAQASWFDTITISGGAPGSNVKLLATLVLDIGQFDATASGTFAGATSLITMTTGFANSGFWCGFSASGFVNPSTPCAGSTGGVGVGRNEISFEVETTFGAHDWYVQLQMGSDVQTQGLGQAGGGFAIGDALNTAHSYFTVLTPGATMQWASGHDYNLPPVQAVPEPSTHALLVAGLVVLGFAARRRRGH
jgi:hypothetical protein